ncbi:MULTISPECIES: ISL3 family transposase, partial [unclassified Enterococcus]|uniref:ISL3 family transposase n=1 Tax=unclassified Enterococcus TaxID=2608891 RepID=UPI002472FCB9
RFFCKSCGQTFLAEDTITDRHCWISNRVKLSIAERLTEPLTMSFISRLKHVSVTTVLRVLHRFYETKPPQNSDLPIVLCMDEFKSVKNVAGSMSFIMMDGQTKELIDIVDNRQLPNLRNYFSRFSLAAREQVQVIVSDFYSPYDSLRKEYFPNAQLVIDRFHISQHIGRAFLTERIARMKLLAKGTYQEKRHYGQLKRYWKLLQKNEWDLAISKRYWRPRFKAHLSEVDIVARLLSYDSQLKESYDYYQELLSAIRWKNTERFDELINRDLVGLPPHYQRVIQTFRKYRQEIHNAFTLPYSNGSLECENNHIKVLKRISYGFRSFKNFKLRIFLLRGKYFWKEEKSSQAMKAA